MNINQENNIDQQHLKILQLKDLQRILKNQCFRTIYENSTVQDLKNQCTAAKDVHLKHPYKNICKITVVIKKDTYWGTGFFINSRIVVTAAHILYELISKERWDRKAKKGLTPSPQITQFIFVHPEERPQNEPGRVIKVQRFIFHRKFQSQENDHFDIAILILEDNNLFKLYHHLNLNLDYEYQKYKKNKILLSGYNDAKNRQCQNKRIVQFQERKQPQRQVQNILHYKMHASVGNSGSPILLIHLDNQQQTQQYEVIGIHTKGKLSGAMNYGILLGKSQQTNSLINLIKKLYYDKLLSVQQNNQKMKLQILAIQQLFKKNIDKRSIQPNIYIKAGDLIISKDLLTSSKYQLLEQKYFTPSNNEFNIVQQDEKEILELFSSIHTQYLIVGLQKWKYMFGTYQDINLTKEQRQQCYAQLQNFIKINLGHVSCNDQIEACSRIAKKMFQFEKNVYYRKLNYFIQSYFQNYEQDKSSQIEELKVFCKQKQKILMQKLSLKEEKQSFKEEKQQIIKEYDFNKQKNKIYQSFKQLILKGFDIKNVNFSKRSQNRYINELNFEISNVRIAQSLNILKLKYDNTIQNIQLNLLKGKAMQVAEHYKTANYYYRKAIIKIQQIQQGQTLQYIRILLKMVANYLKYDQFSEASKLLNRANQFLSENQQNIEQYIDFSILTGIMLRSQQNIFHYEKPRIQILKGVFFQQKKKETHIIIKQSKRQIFVAFIFQNALKLTSSLYISNHPIKYVRLLAQMAINFVGMDNKRADQFYLKSQKQLKNLPETQILDTLEIYFIFVGILYKRKKYQEAIQKLRNILLMIRFVKSKTSSQSYKVCYFLGICYYTRKDYRKCAQTFENYLKLFKEEQSERSKKYYQGYFMQCCHFLITSYKQLGNKQKQQQVWQKGKNILLARYKLTKSINLELYKPFITSTLYF